MLRKGEETDSVVYRLEVEDKGLTGRKIVMLRNHGMIEA